MSDELVQQILAANRAFYAALRARDLRAMAECWANALDVSCVHPGQDALVGRALVLGSWERIFQSDSQLSVWPEQERVQVGERHGWVVCHEQLQTVVQGQTVEQRLIAVNTFKLESEGWRICHHQASPILRDGTPRASASPPPKETLH